MVARQIFHSLKVKSVWAVKSDGKTLSEHFTQVESLTAAVKAARAVRRPVASRRLSYTKPMVRSVKSGLMEKTRRRSPDDLPANLVHFSQCQGSPPQLLMSELGVDWQEL